MRVSVFLRLTALVFALLASISQPGYCDPSPSPSLSAGGQANALSPGADPSQKFKTDGRNSLNDMAKEFLLKNPEVKYLGRPEWGGSDRREPETGKPVPGFVNPALVRGAGPLGTVFPPTPAAAMGWPTESKVVEGMYYQNLSDLDGFNGWENSDLKAFSQQVQAGNMMAKTVQYPLNAAQQAQAATQAQAIGMGNAAGDVAKNQAAAAMDYCAKYLQNFTAQPGNKWNQIRDTVFVPIGILLLLPGAVLAQVRATVAIGYPISQQTSSPLEGIIRSTIAIFLIPGTYLVVNYSIDFSNSITYTLADEYTRLFGTSMYHDALCAEMRAFPVRGPKENQNAGMATNWPTSQIKSIDGLEKNLLESKKDDPCSGQYNAPANKTDEGMPGAAAWGRMLNFGANALMTSAWNVLCAFQMAYMLYLFFVGPVVAGLWVWPIRQFREALPNWIEGVLTLAFWSLFWNTSILLMACFKGIDDTGSIYMTALNFLATASVKYAFDFVGLIKAAGQEAAKLTGVAGGGGGAGGGSGGGSASAPAHLPPSVPSQAPSAPSPVAVGPQPAPTTPIMDSSTMSPASPGGGNMVPGSSQGNLTTVDNAGRGGVVMGSNMFISPIAGTPPLGSLSPAVIGPPPSESGRSMLSESFTAGDLEVTRMYDGTTESSYITYDGKNLGVFTPGNGFADGTETTKFGESTLSYIRKGNLVGYQLSGKNGTSSLFLSLLADGSATQVSAADAQSLLAGDQTAGAGPSAANQSGPLAVSNGYGAVPIVNLSSRDGASGASGREGAAGAGLSGLTLVSGAGGLASGGATLPFSTSSSSSSLYYDSADYLLSNAQPLSAFGADPSASAVSEPSVIPGGGAVYFAAAVDGNVSVLDEVAGSGGGSVTAGVPETVNANLYYASEDIRLTGVQSLSNFDVQAPPQVSGSLSLFTEAVDGDEVASVTPLSNFMPGQVEGDGTPITVGASPIENNLFASALNDKSQNVIGSITQFLSPELTIEHDAIQTSQPHVLQEVQPATSAHRTGGTEFLKELVSSELIAVPISVLAVSYTSDQQNSNVTQNRNETHVTNTNLMARNSVQLQKIQKAAAENEFDFEPEEELELESDSADEAGANKLLNALGKAAHSAQGAPGVPTNISW